TRLDQLEAFIAQGKALIGLSPASAVSASTSESAQVLRLFKGKPNSEKVRDLLKEFNRPMHIPEIVQEFRKRNWPLSSKNPREVLRNTLRGKPEIFTKTKGGAYGLKRVE
ncbi:MAG: hypothetical protein WAK96_00475, partial [Desulfobaccales bacterium]